MEEKKIEEAGWNLAEHLIYEIAHHFSNSRDYFVIGKWDKAMLSLRSVRLSVSSDLTEPQKKKLDVVESFFWRAFQRMNPGGFKPTDSRQTYLADKSYKYYSDLLNGYLKPLGYLVPRRKDKTQM